MLAKVSDWLSAGSALVWIVDPPRETVTVYRDDGSVGVLGTAHSAARPCYPNFYYRCASCSSGNRRGSAEARYVGRSITPFPSPRRTPSRSAMTPFTMTARYPTAY